MTAFDWTPEEQAAYQLARSWRDRALQPDTSGMDWLRFARVITANRMGVLALRVLDARGIQIPADARARLDEQADKYRRLAGLFRQPLVTFLRAAADQGISVLLLKGLWLCDKVYGDPAIRPGADIDLLVPRRLVDPTIAILRAQGIDAFWPNLLSDEYFTRHHLHQQRSSSDLQIWFEIHWALDHPYTLLTVDYEGIFARAARGELFGAPLQEMTPSDLLLTLVIHLVKHAVYLPSLVDRPDLPRIILADGMLMHYLDVAEVLRQFGSRMDWALTVRLARSWGAVDALAAVLRVCNLYLGTALPPGILSELSAAPVPALTTLLMARAVEQKIAAYSDRPISRFWQLLLASNGAFILRPIRLLETLAYFFPPRDYFQRRYGTDGLLIRARHFALAVFQTIRFVVDAFYFAWERYRRLKRMGRSASLFQRLDADL